MWRRTHPRCVGQSPVKEEEYRWVHVGFALVIKTGKRVRKSGDGDHRVI